MATTTERPKLSRQHGRKNVTGSDRYAAGRALAQPPCEAAVVAVDPPTAGDGRS